MIGFELQPNLAAFAGSNQAASLQLVNRLHEAGLLTIPAGTQVVRLLPPLNLRIEEAREAIQIIESVISRLI